MVFDVYGRFLIEVLRENDGWVLRRLEPGKRMILHDVAIPSDVPEDLIPRVLEDVLHEFAVPDRRINKSGR
jgi:hypothetical protein